MDDIISNKDYDETNPVYQKIKREFTNKLKQKYECEDYDAIINYIFNYVFKNKATKQQCITKLDSIFNNKSEFMVDYLWKITKEAEYSFEKSDSDSDFNNFRTKKKNEIRKSRLNKYQRDRSRSYSRERSRERPINKFDFDNYLNYPPMMPKGFYPPKGRFRGPIMPMGGAYPPYIIPPPVKR